MKRCVPTPPISARRHAALLAGGLLATAWLTALPAPAADVVFVDITIKNHRFEPAEPKVPAGSPVIIRVHNQDATPEEFESNALRVEKVVTGKGTIAVKVAPQKPGRYKFFGEYHEKTAQGVLVVE